MAHALQALAFDHSRAKSRSETDGTVYLHVVMLPAEEDATTASGAAATFMPATLATIDGNQPDGNTWFATFQLAADDRDSAWVEQAADAAILRALNLIGLGDENVWGQALRADDLRSAYEIAGAGDVNDWSVSDLVTGLLIELTNRDLASVVVACGRSAPPDAEVEARRTRLHDLLASWAATYEARPCKRDGGPNSQILCWPGRTAGRPRGR